MDRLHQKWDLGIVVSATTLGAGAVSAQGAVFKPVDFAQRMLLLIKGTQACEVYVYRGDLNGNFGWGTLAATVSGSTGGAYADVGVPSTSAVWPLGHAVKFAVKNTGAGAGDFEVRAVLIG